MKKVYKDGNYQVLIRYISDKEVASRSFVDHYYLAKSLNRLSEIDKTIEYIKPILAQVKMEGDIKYLKMIYELIWAYHRKGEMSEASRYLDNAYKVINSLSYAELPGSKKQTVNSIINLGGVIHYSIGKLEQAKHYFEQLLEYSDDIENEEVLQSGKINLALIHLDGGDYREAIELLLGALDLAEKNQHQEHVRVSTNNLAYIYTIIGDLSKAEKYARKTIEVAEENNDKWGLALIFNNLGLIMYKQGSHDESLEYLDRSHKLMKEFENPEYLARIQFFRLLVHLDLENRFEANEALQEIRSYADGSDNSRILLIYEIADAIYLGTSGLYRHKLDAEDSLKALINSELDIESELVSYVYLHLTQLLLEQVLEIQYEFKGDHTELHEDEQNVIEEIDGLSNEILNIADRQNSPELRLQVHHIQAHLSMLRLDTESLSHHLDEADKISGRWGLSKLTITEPDLNQVELQRDMTIVPFTITTSINDIIHSFPRLKIMVVLAKETKLTFSDLQEYVKLSSGNLSNHCKILVDKNYMIKTKEVVEDKFQTLYSMTNVGFQAFMKYKTKVRQILAAHDR